VAHLIPQDEFLVKLSSLREADLLGRQLAMGRAVTELAKIAGAAFAQVDEPEMEKIAAGMEKVAWDMVQQGELSPEQFQFLKEAGIFSSIGRFISKRAPKLDIAAGKVRSRLRSFGQRFKRQPRVAPSVPQQAARPAPTTTGPRVRRKGKVQPAQQRQQGAVMTERGDIRAAPASGGPTVEHVQRRPGYKPSKPQATPTGYTSGAAPTGAGRPATAPRSAPPAGAEQVGGAGGPYRRSGRVKEAPKEQPKSSTQRSQEMADQAATKQRTTQQQTTQQQTAQQTGQQPQQQQGWWQRLTGGGQPKKPSYGLGRLALYGGLGLGAYGLYKGVGWGARQLEQASTTPMAYGGGWSPVPYGYGHTPYGPGMPTMGPGA
jgi:hypothetical protein